MAVYYLNLMPSQPVRLSRGDFEVGREKWGRGGTSCKRKYAQIDQQMYRQIRSEMGKM